jgi:two-component system, OmpR family, sensor histidine kinase BaeS
MKSLRSRFVLSHLLPILMIVPLVGLILLYLLETQILITETSENITAKANLIAETVNGRPELLQNAAQAEGFVSGISIYIDERVLLLGANGQILAATTLDPGVTEEQPLDLQGLETAISGSPSLVITYGFSGGQEAIALVPVKDINEQIIGIVGVTDTLSGAASQISRLRTVVLGVLLLELLLGVIVGYLLARRLEKPILRSATAVVDIAGGKEIAPVPVEGPTEIRELSAAVNTLSDRLRLLEDSRRRSLANIVHELGRPLGAIRSAVHVLRSGKAGEDPQIREELLGGIEKAIENLRPLLDDLAQLHGQVEGSVQLHRRPVALSDWLPPLLLPWRASAQEKGLVWQADIPPDLPTLSLDPDRLAQAAGNLLSNAIKYTPQGGSISVTAEVTAGEVALRICDTGRGILPGERTLIFEPFFRSKQERRFPQGLGLGLTIARDLVEAHDGRLELESSPSGGSCFTIYLPQENP